MKRAVVAVALVAAATRAEAASLMLTDTERADAIRIGARSVVDEAFGAEWRASDGRGNTVVVMTPFHRLALAARHAAFDGRELKPTEPQRILRQDANRLVVWVTLRGTSEEFARRYVPTLRLGDRSLRPSFIQNEHTAARQEDGAYVARCVYAFPTREMSGTARGVLSVSDSDGREVTHFPIDLAAMR